jgi:hypothetical protein
VALMDNFAKISTTHAKFAMRTAWVAILAQVKLGLAWAARCSLCGSIHV